MATDPTNQTFVLPVGTVLTSENGHTYTIERADSYGQQQNNTSEEPVSSALGQGGFGITYLASTPFDEGKVYYAIKEFFLKDFCWRDKDGVTMMYSPSVETAVLEFLKDFTKEANCLSEICQKNRHVVQVMEVFKANNTAYYVMEFLDGGSLSGKVEERQEPFSETEALSMLLPIAEAVDSIHREYHLLHCDIKPSNIMIRRSSNGHEEPVLIDFGESRHFKEDGNLTTLHNMSGCTEGFAPPEQYAGITSFLPQTDVYALSATLFYLLTKTRPVKSFDIDNGYIDRSLPPETMPVVRQAIKHGMQREARKRTPDVAQFIDELTGNSSSYSEPSSFWKRLPLLVAAAVLLLAVLFGKSGLAYVNLAIARSHMEKGDTIKAIPYLKKAAGFGNTDAMNELGGCYIDGTGVAKDYKKGYELYKQSAEAGNLWGMSCIGACYYNGWYVQADKAEALSWFKAAADKGDPHGQFNLAVYYHYKGDTEKSLDYYNKAAKQDFSPAQLELGHICYNSKDYENAVKWYTKAANNNNSKAMLNLADCLEHGTGIEMDKQKAEYWRNKAYKKMGK